MEHAPVAPSKESLGEYVSRPRSDRSIKPVDSEQVCSMREI